MQEALHSVVRDSSRFWELRLNSSFRERIRLLEFHSFTILLTQRATSLQKDPEYLGYCRTCYLRIICQRSLHPASYKP